MLLTQRYAGSSSWQWQYIPITASHKGLHALQQALQPIEALVDKQFARSRAPGPGHTHRNHACLLQQDGPAGAMITCNARQLDRVQDASDAPLWLRHSMEPKVLQPCQNKPSDVLSKNATCPTAIPAAGRQAAAGWSHAAGMRLSGLSTAAIRPRLPACTGGSHNRRSLNSSGTMSHLF